MDDTYHIQVNKASTRYFSQNYKNLAENTPKCSTCNMNPVYDIGRNLCIVCFENADKNSACYSCKLCVQSREYIGATDANFQLICYDRCQFRNTEIWLCKQCNKCLEIELICPGVSRDMIHELLRRIHLTYLCEKFKSGELSF